MEKRKGLNRTTLKIIAICSMVIDHTAWGFLDFYTPLAQFLHVCGRLTIPIMCFFIAEGFRKTSNLARYIERMAGFAVVAMIPFYIFFSEEYEWRQNIIFDLLLALLALTVLESKAKKWAKVLLMGLLFLVSMTIGGWVVMPIVYVIIFYYGKNFRQKAILFCVSTVSLVLFLMGAISLNSIYHFSHYEWVWWDKSYLLGFMLALPLLYFYNGEKGKDFGGRYFFYGFYPLHFLVLAGIRYLTGNPSSYGIYLGIHIATVIACVFLLVLSSKCRPSRGQSAIILFEFAATVYAFGFVLEILANTMQGYHFAVVVEYLGEAVVMIGVLYYTRVLYNLHVPLCFYLLQVVVGILLVGAVVTTPDNGFFYREMAVDLSGTIPRLQLTYGPGFYLTMVYFVSVCLILVGCSVYTAIHSTGVIAKRAGLNIIGCLCMWLPYVLKLVGLTGGYEVPGLGVLLAEVVFYRILMKYNFLDSATLASDNLLEHGNQGLVVIGGDDRIQFQNTQARIVFGDLNYGDEAGENELLARVINGELTEYTVNGRIYGLKYEILREGNVACGSMISAVDITERMEALEKIREQAIRDSLTGLYNRMYFQNEMERICEEDGTGCFFLVDMDNFKQVNDRLGHQAGDDVLTGFAEVLKAFPDHQLLSCRLGGDEYAGFIQNVTYEASITNTFDRIMQAFSEKLAEKGLRDCTSISVGAVLCTKNMITEKKFETLYSLADRTMYEAKEAGKNCYRMIQAE